MVPSKLPLANRSPSGEKASVWTSVGCPQKVARCSPIATSHNQIDTFSVHRHQAPEARYRPHGENANTNVRSHPSGSRNTMRISCVVVSHNRISPPPNTPPPAIQRPQGENVMTSRRRGRKCLSARDNDFTSCRISGTFALNSAAVNGVSALRKLSELKEGVS